MVNVLSYKNLSSAHIIETHNNTPLTSLSSPPLSSSLPYPPLFPLLPSPILLPSLLSPPSCPLSLLPSFSFLPSPPFLSYPLSSHPSPTPSPPLSSPSLSSPLLLLPHTSHSIMQIIVLTFVYFLLWLVMAVLLGAVTAVYIQLAWGCPQIGDLTGADGLACFQFGSDDSGGEWREG